MEKQHLTEIEAAELALFKKKLKKMKEFKGRGTELISLYLPPDVDRGTVTGQLTEETSQSSNIKSPQTRKNVQGALRKIDNFLKQIKFRLPNTGLVIFAGNVSGKEGRSDIQLMTIKPVKPLRTKLYWCDSSFHLAPLEEMVVPTDVFGILVIDKSDATIAILIGKKYEILGRFTSGISGKHRAGGQCLAPNSLVMLSDGKIIEMDKCNNPSGIKTANFEDFSIEDSFINDKWHTVKPESFRIVTKNPRNEIICSKDHSLFCWDNGKIRERPAEKLKEGDFLLMPERVKVDGNMQKLQNNLFNSFKVLESGRKKLKETRLKLGVHQGELAKKAGLHQANISALELGKFCPRFKTLEKICGLMGIDFNEFSQKHCKPKSRVALPAELDNGLAQFIGYFLGDGSFENERITLFEQRKEVAEKYKRLAQKLFNANINIRFRESKNYFSVRIYGKPIVKYLKKNFPELEKSKAIPEKILKSGNDILAAFMKGLFDAEGYVSKHHVALGMNNEKIVKQLQLALLRFGMLSGLHVYDNKGNPYSNNPRFTVQLDEKKSLELFKAKIGFSAKEKAGKVSELISGTGDKSSTRQIVLGGKQVREIIERHGFKVSDFPRVTNFFRNERMIGKQTFKNSIIKFAKSKEMLAEFEKILEKEILPVKIKKIIKEAKPLKMVDISVKNQNFIANGLIVHNSAQRFERLHEEATKEFYRRISEKINKAFLPHEDKLKGIIIAGPGMTKNYFLNRELVDHRLRKKILGQIDTSYTDESGIREVVQKADEILKGADIVREKQIVQRLLEAIVKNGLGAYGQKEVETALEMGKVAVLLISEGIEWMVFKFHCEKCGKDEEIVVKQPEKFRASDYKCKCGNTKQFEVIEEIDYADWLMEKAHSTGAEIHIVSTETVEGEQFFNGFGGIGAIRRY